MQLSSIPLRLKFYWGQAADPAFIREVPTDSQIGVQTGAASYQTGFVPDNFNPVTAGGVPPFGQDFNGGLRAATQVEQWIQAGGNFPWDATFSSQIGGYPKNAIVASAIVPGKMWLSTVDDNTTNPDDVTSANWVTPPGISPSGTPIPSFSSTVLPNCVLANGNTIGNAISGAATAAAVTIFVFAAIWQQYSNSICPIFNSDGTPGTRGANPFADFAANKRLATPTMQASGLVGVDTMGGTVTARLAGVPIIAGNTTSPGSQIGENLHVLITGELAAHVHANSLGDPTHRHVLNDPSHLHQYGLTSFAGGAGSGVQSAAPGLSLTPSNVNTVAAATGITMNFASTGMTITNASAGSDTGHNTVHRSFSVFWNLPL